MNTAVEWALERNKLTFIPLQTGQIPSTVPVQLKLSTPKHVMKNVIVEIMSENMTANCTFPQMEATDLPRVAF